MKSYVSELQRKLTEQLAIAGHSYLWSGLSMFYDRIYYNEHANPQVIVGNIAIGIELILKGFIARKSLLLLFKELSLEARALLSCPDKLPANFGWRVYDLEFKSATRKIIDFSECVSIFFIFFP